MAQGSTLDKLIVDLTKPDDNFGVDFAYVYVAISRAKSSKDVFILRDFDKNILKINIPSELKIENERLYILQEINVDNIDKIYCE